AAGAVAASGPAPVPSRSSLGWVDLRMTAVTMPGYRFEELLEERSWCVVSRAVREADGRPVIIRRLRAARVTTEDITRLRQEYELIRDPALPGVVHALALDESSAGPALVLEAVEGEPLDALLASGPLPIEQVLYLGAQLAGTLAGLHRRGIV